MGTEGGAAARRALDPRAQHPDGVRGQRRDALLAAFPDRADVRARSKLCVAAGEAEQLRDA